VQDKRFKPHKYVTKGLENKKDNPPIASSLIKVNPKNQEVEEESLHRTPTETVSYPDTNGMNNDFGNSVKKDPVPVCTLSRILRVPRTQGYLYSIFDRITKKN